MARPSGRPGCPGGRQPLPPGDRLLSFEVGYAWQACAAPVRRAGQALRRGPRTPRCTPFAARRYVAGHADTGKYLKLTATATEVVETDPATFTFRVIRSSRSYTARRTGPALPQLPAGP